MTAPDPVRLRVSYTSPRSLLGELTRAVGRREVTLESRRPVPPGTRFVFELHAHGVAEPLEVLGEVVACEPLQGPAARYRLGIRYDPGAGRRGLDEALQWIFETHRHDRGRREHPRIPIHVLAQGDAPGSPHYLVRDLSRGGLGVEVEAGELPRGLQVGAPFLLELAMPAHGPLLLHGEVAWVAQPPPERARLVSPAFGVRFGTLRADAVERLEHLLALRGLPPPPWRARLSFGMDAVSRMP